MVTCKECTKRPSFGLLGQLPGYCGKHKKDGMVNVVDKRCKECNKHPNFGLQGQSPEYCSNHKKDGMVDITHKKCKECNKQPIFGLQGQSPEYCSYHKKDGMIDVVNKKCKECDKNPSFSLPGKCREYCNDHKKDGMIESVNIKCRECNKQPTFGLQGQSPECCKIHATKDMVDVRHNRCHEQNCSVRTSYGLPGLKPTHCTTHGLNKNGFIKNPKSKCIVCKNQALYGLTMPTHCEQHKTLDEFNMVERQCKKCNQFMILDTEGQCLDYCSRWETVRLYKQNVIKNLFDTNHIKYDSYDKSIDPACGKERPDFVFDCKTHITVFEVDENAHRGYPCECEQTRMVNITQAYFLPTVFIRYNPDKYTDHKGNPEILSENQKHQLVLKWLKRMLNSAPQNILTVLYICYDGFNKNNINDNLYTIPLK